MTEQQFLELIDKYLAGKATPEEITLLDELDSRFDREQDVELNDPERRLLQQRMLENITLKRKRAIIRQTWKRVMSAAAIFILLLTTSIWVFRRHHRFEQTPSITWKEVKAGIGQQIQYSLPDGSTVKLNAGSKLIFPAQFKGNTRKVTLIGEAFFSIVQDPSKPFQVLSGQIMTRVLGTSFNIQAYPSLSTIRIGVATGKVSISRDSQTLATLIAGQEAISSRSNKDLPKIAQVNITDIGDWQSGALVFRQAPMEEVVNALQNKFGVTIQIDRQTILQGRITTRLAATSNLNEMLDIITTINKTHYTIKGKRVFIDRKHPRQ